METHAHRRYSWAKTNFEDIKHSSTKVNLYKNSAYINRKIDQHTGKHWWLMDVIYLPVEGVVCRTMPNLVPDIIHSCSVFLHPNLLSVQRETRGEITDCLTESCSGLNSPVPRFNEELWIYISLSFHDPVSSPRSQRGLKTAHLPLYFSTFSSVLGFSIQGLYAV